MVAAAGASACWPRRVVVETCRLADTGMRRQPPASRHPAHNRHGPRRCAPLSAHGSSTAHRYRRAGAGPWWPVYEVVHAALGPGALVGMPARRDRAARRQRAGMPTRTTPASATYNALNRSVRPAQHHPSPGFGFTSPA